MDLRVAKTRNAMRRAFMTLRKKHAPEKIRVVEICELAQINKSTFYKHYHDIFELSDEVKQATVDKFWADFPEKGLMLTDPRTFMVGLPRAVDQLGGAVLLTLFKDEGEDFFRLLEQKLIDNYISDDNTPADNIKITFIICGIIHILKAQRSSRHYDNSEVADEVGRLILSFDSAPK